MLEVELARRVSEPAALWRLEGLQRELASLNVAAANEAERVAIRSVAVRAERFATIAARHRSAHSVAPPVALTKTGPMVAPPVMPGPATPAYGVAPQAVTGELRTVVSKTQRADSPRYALVDSQGRVTTFVTPQVGMDLTPLVGKQVSVTGAQGYLPTIGRSTVSATRVAQLPPAAAPLVR